MNHFEFKAALSIDDAGVVTGIAWPANSRDTTGDLITKGAFNVAVEDLPMLLNHDPNAIIGLWDEVKETERGLEVKGHLSLKESDRARAVRSLIKSRLIDGLSIGFDPVTTTGARGRRTISSLNLFEISIVKSPANAGARLTSIKSAEARLAAYADAIQRATAALRT